MTPWRPGIGPVLLNTSIDGVFVKHMRHIGAFNAGILIGLLIVARRCAIAKPRRVAVRLNVTVIERTESASSLALARVHLEPKWIKEGERVTGCIRKEIQSIQVHSRC